MCLASHLILLHLDYNDVGCKVFEMWLVIHMSPAPSVDFGYMSNIEDNVQLKFGGFFVFLSFVLFVWCAA